MKSFSKLLISCALAGASALPAHAAPQPVTFAAHLEPADARAGEGAQVVVGVTIQRPWHLYSTTQPDGGSTRTTLALSGASVLKAVGKVIQPPPRKEPNSAFGIVDELYRDSVSFGIPVTIAASASGNQKATVAVHYQVCSDTMCLIPTTVQVPVTFAIAPGAARPARAKPVTRVPAQAAGAFASAAAGGPTDGSGGPPPGVATSAAAMASVSANAGASDSADRIRAAQSSGIGGFLLLAFLNGFLALLTPCVFPMIPITVSFFAKRGESGVAQGRAGLAGPVAYCLGIVGTFTAIGLAITALFGASGITRFAANPWLNLGMAALFGLLALNLFGVYEITVPQWLLQRVQPQRTAGAANKPSLLAPLLMGLAFTLTSFTCTVPFVGTLLVATARGGTAWPALGMLAFSTAFASPFFLLALFPQWLARLPKAGGWLVSVKAYMGFLELAAALKFLSNADMVWREALLTRPVFLSLWCTIAVIAGFYLLCWLRLPHDAVGVRPGPVRRGLGLVTVALGAYLLLATGGASLGEFDAYLPPRDYGAAPVAAGASGDKVSWIVDDYDRALGQSRSQDKPLLINFTGYTCTNCRLMEAHVLPHPLVTAQIANFIPLELHTDGQDAASRSAAQLERDKFGTVALPLYVVVSPQGRELGRIEGLERDPQIFASFLRDRSTTRVALLAGSAPVR